MANLNETNMETMEIEETTMVESTNESVGFVGKVKGFVTRHKKALLIGGAIGATLLTIRMMAGGPTDEYSDENEYGYGDPVEVEHKDVSEETATKKAE